MRARKFQNDLPEFAAELEVLLTQAGEPALADAVRSLPLVDRCRCGDGFCATFYTAPPPNGPFGPGHRTVVLEPNRGMINIDVVDDRIMCIEVLERPDVKAELLARLP